MARFENGGGQTYNGSKSAPRLTKSWTRVVLLPMCRSGAAALATAKSYASASCASRSVATKSGITTKPASSSARAAPAGSSQPTPISSNQSFIGQVPAGRLTEDRRLRLQPVLFHNLNLISGVPFCPASPCDKISCQFSVTADFRPDQCHGDDDDDGPDAAGHGGHNRAGRRRVAQSCRHRE